MYGERSQVSNDLEKSVVELFLRVDGSLLYILDILTKNELNRTSLMHADDIILWLSPRVLEGNIENELLWEIGTLQRKNWWNNLRQILSNNLSQYNKQMKI
jgi:hypothetical protein